MAPALLTHLSLASSHRASIAFFFLIITLFLVPFLSALTSELIPIALPRFASTLWHSLLGIVTSSPFYFLLLNFLIAALVFLSGALDPSPSGREPDGLHEGDVHRRGLHDFSTAAQIIHERLALFDELYESQAPSLPYLNIAERSHIYVTDDRMICNGGSDVGEVHDGKGKQIMADPIDSILHQRPAFSDADGCDAAEEGSNNGRMDATEGFFLAGSMVGDESDMKAKDIQVYDKTLHQENDMDTDVDANTNAYADAHQMHNVDVISNDQKGGSDVIDAEDGNDVIHDDEGGADDVDDGNVHNHECNSIDAEADGDKDHKRQRQRIPRTPSEPVIAGTMHAQQGENVGAELGEEGRGRCMSLERVHWLGSSMEKQREKAREEVMMSMSREELNERASAFISAFHKKLVSTAIDDDVSGHM